MLEQSRTLKVFRIVSDGALSCAVVRRAWHVIRVPENAALEVVFVL